MSLLTKRCRALDLASLLHYKLLMWFCMYLFCLLCLPCGCIHVLLIISTFSPVKSLHAATESIKICPMDCCPKNSTRCGDRVCDAWAGENCHTCPQDCASEKSSVYVGLDPFCCGLDAPACSDKRCVRLGFKCNSYCAPANTGRRRFKL